MAWKLQVYLYLFLWLVSCKLTPVPSPRNPDFMVAKATCFSCVYCLKKKNRGCNVIRRCWRSNTFWSELHFIWSWHLLWEETFLTDLLIQRLVTARKSFARRQQVLKMLTLFFILKRTHTHERTHRHTITVRPHSDSMSKKTVLQRMCILNFIHCNCIQEMWELSDRKECFNKIDKILSHKQEKDRGQ